MFANFHVDSIQEFVPVPAGYCSSSFVSSAVSVQGQEASNSEYLCNENCPSNQSDAENTHEHFGDNAETPMPGEETENEENNTLCCHHFHSEPTYEHDYYEHDERLLSENNNNNNNYEYYFDNEEDYEDYEDQLLIDSLTEEEALALLRSESEMYALQMSQAAKLGISMNEIKECDDAVTSSAELVDTASSSAGVNIAEEDSLSCSKEISDSNNNDIFENVFSYEYSDAETCEQVTPAQNEQSQVWVNKFKKILTI